MKQVIESNKGMYKPEGRLFVSQEDEEPRRFKKNIADCMGAPIKQKVEGLLESLLSQYEQSTTDNDVLELDDAAILAQASSQGNIVGEDQNRVKTEDDSLEEEDLGQELGSV